MKKYIGLGIVGVVAIGLAGCEPVDYYPQHEAAQHTSLQAGDLRKAGSGEYGGNNSDYPLGTPGTTQPTSASSRRVPPTRADPGGGLTFNANGQGAFSQTDSYSGADTGGSNSAEQPSGPGTTMVGAAAGH